MPKTVMWIVVADGAKAHIVRQPRTGAPLEAVPGADFVNPETGRTRELGTDKPGRSIDSMGGGRSSMENVDWHRYEKKRFAHGIAERLETAAETDAFHKLVLVAPPETLGEMRLKLGKHAKAKVCAEIAKDLTGVAMADLANHLGDVVRVAEKRGA
ncbi:MAG: host attachment protein [Gemmatimonas sp.]